MTSPYLQKNRLSDVIAGITALGTYKFYKLDFSNWSDRISGSAENADHWKSVFVDHPEFFRLNAGGDKASLVWRRQFPKSYDVDQKRDVPIPTGEKHHSDVDRISRRPLEPAELTALINIATNLHNSALEQAKAKKWWVPIIPGLLALVGATIGAILTKI